MAGVPYTKQHPKDEGKLYNNDFIKSGLYNTDKASAFYEYRRERERERENFRKKKKSKSVRNDFTVK